ncbi:MAG: zinc-ribbon domain-containing protein [Oscillospiraceae bacterium]|nr:zinc-ribbon domain-containing protein [Oscillospiraceae bacterium]
MDFDHLVNKAKGLADMAGKKTEEMLEISRLKYSCVQLNNEIQHSYEKLGAFTYKFQKTGEENPELVEMCVKEIDGLLEKLKELTARIDEAQHRSRCSACGAMNEEKAAYCIKCGAKMPEEPVEEPECPDEECASNEPCDGEQPPCEAQ